ncbi:PadR family transcriptional regulator [Draconibacterium sp. IB214405]|uniref:PadR family transcriptional regulator n=1 Tax=Draconibacterium sp. IB214405 TaxID=3097352 RepID=UPI002A0E02CE|nr:PadR family transcriptional regulator [Draconibacterium sp. IB214405]MDX8341780.1 PadR family transcriptional regulator [Draconibacterium sp. IB214405]
MKVNNISRELIGASAIPLILAILKEGDSYGYEIIQKVYELSNEKIKWKDGSLYPVLKKLEQQGYIRSYWNTSGTRARRYFSLLQVGEKELEKEFHNWQLIHTMLIQLCKPQPNSI